jgi:putative nucleotidyltransferase with HDIG domain
MGIRVAGLEKKLGEFYDGAVGINDGLSGSDSYLAGFDSLRPLMDGLKISQGKKAFVYGLLWDLYHVQDSRDAFNHTLRVAYMARDAALEAGLDRDKATLAALVHDVGKAYVPDRVLSKPGVYSEEDMAEMRKHSGYSYELLSSELPWYANVALEHHAHQELGYPKLEDLPKVLVPGSEEEVTKYAKFISKYDHKDASATRNDEWEKRSDVRLSNGKFLPVPSA